MACLGLFLNEFISDLNKSMIIEGFVMFPFFLF